MLAHFGSALKTVALGGAAKNLRRYAVGCLTIAAQVEALRGTHLGLPTEEVGEHYVAAVLAATTVLSAEDQALMRHYVVQAGLAPADFGL